MGNDATTARQLLCSLPRGLIVSRVRIKRRLLCACTGGRERVKDAAMLRVLAQCTSD